jgi:hypothetical protein
MRPEGELPGEFFSSESLWLGACSGRKRRTNAMMNRNSIPLIAVTAIAALTARGRPADAVEGRS